MRFARGGWWAGLGFCGLDHPVTTIRQAGLWNPAHQGRALFPLRLILSTRRRLPPPPRLAAWPLLLLPSHSHTSCAHGAPRRLPRGGLIPAACPVATPSPAPRSTPSPHRLPRCGELERLVSIQL